MKQRVTPPTSIMPSKTRGNILFLTLLAVVLFAALSYAVMQSMQGGGNDASSEITDLENAKQADYVTLVQNAALRLEMIEGCTSIDYTIPEDQPGSGDFSCYMYHPSGGAVPYIDYGLDSCVLSGTDITTLSAGDTCGTLIFISYYNGHYMFTNNANLDNTNWHWTPYATTGATSYSDGDANSDKTKTFFNNGASKCRTTYGDNWYLPSRNELTQLYNVKNQGALNGTIPTDDWYWSSTESANHAARYVDLSTNASNGTTKNGFNYHRCFTRVEP